MPIYRPKEKDDPLLLYIKAGEIDKARAFLNEEHYDTLDISNSEFISNIDKMVINSFMEKLGESLQQTDVIALYLKGNNISGHAALFLTASLPNDLTSLNLSNNQIGARDALLLDRYLPRSLKSLNLAWNCISSSAPYLVEKLPTSVEWLDLSHNDLHEGEGLELLEKLQGRAICRIDVSDNEISADTVAQIQAVALKNGERNYPYPEEDDDVERMILKLTEVNLSLDVEHQVILPPEISVHERKRALLSTFVLENERRVEEAGERVKQAKMAEQVQTAWKLTNTARVEARSAAQAAWNEVKVYKERTRQLEKQVAQLAQKQHKRIASC